MTSGYPCQGTTLSKAYRQGSRQRRFPVRHPQVSAALTYALAPLPSDFWLSSFIESLPGVSAYAQANVRGTGVPHLEVQYKHMSGILRTCAQMTWTIAAQGLRTCGCIGFKLSILIGILCIIHAAMHDLQGSMGRALPSQRLIQLS